MVWLTVVILEWSVPEYFFALGWLSDPSFPSDTFMCPKDLVLYLYTHLWYSVGICKAQCILSLRSHLSCFHIQNGLLFFTSCSKGLSKLRSYRLSHLIHKHINIQTHIASLIILVNISFWINFKFIIEDLRIKKKEKQNPI